MFHIMWNIKLYKWNILYNLFLMAAQRRNFLMIYAKICSFNLYLHIDDKVEFIILGMVYFY